MEKENCKIVAIQYWTRFPYCLSFASEAAFCDIDA